MEFSTLIELAIHPSGVLKTHSLNLAPCNFLLAIVDPASTTCQFIVPSRTLKDWLDHFALSSTSSVGATTQNAANRYESELGWYFGDKEVRVKTFEGGGKKGISTEIRVDVGEFEEYWVDKAPVTLTFPMREFRVSLFFLSFFFSFSIGCTFSPAHDGALFRETGSFRTSRVSISTTHYVLFHRQSTSQH
jgi:hypothetical protein